MSAKVSNDIGIVLFAACLVHEYIFLLQSVEIYRLVQATCMFVNWIEERERKGKERIKEMNIYRTSQPPDEVKPP
jgi:hypothetical protein